MTLSHRISLGTAYQQPEKSWHIFLDDMEIKKQLFHWLSPTFSSQLSRSHVATSGTFDKQNNSSCFIHSRHPFDMTTCRPNLYMGNKVKLIRKKLWKNLECSNIQEIQDEVNLHDMYVNQSLLEEKTGKERLQNTSFKGIWRITSSSEP